MINKLYINFDEKNNILTISTPGGNKFILSDKDKSILLKDQNGNSLEMNNTGISLLSGKDIILKAKGKIDLQAEQNITLKSSGDVELKGLNVNANAQIAFSAQGAASAELKASGNTSVKGAMVMIN